MMATLLSRLALPVKGRSIVFTSDVGPHWAGNFLEWPDYATFWQRIADVVRR